MGKLYRNTPGEIDASMVVIASGAGLTAGTVYAFVQRISDSKWRNLDLSWTAGKPVGAAIPVMTHVSGGEWILADTPADVDDIYRVNCIDSGATCYPDNYSMPVLQKPAFDATVAKDSTVAKEATLADVHADLAADAAALAASIAAIPGSAALGIVTALINMGVEISSEFRPIVMEKGGNKALSFRAVDANGVSVNCAGYTAKLAVKEMLTDTGYKIGPLAGVLSAYSDGVQCVWTFTIPPDTTKNMTPFIGKYSVALYDGTGKGVVLNPGGTDYRLLENIIDV